MPVGGNKLQVRAGGLCLGLRLGDRPQAGGGGGLPRPGGPVPGDQADHQEEDDRLRQGQRGEHLWPDQSVQRGGEEQLA